MNLCVDQRVRRICVVRFGGMGDILLATPALRALHRHYTDLQRNCETPEPVEIDLIVGKAMAGAVTGIPYLRRIVEFDKGGPDARPAAFMHFLTDLRKQRYDLFVNFHPSVKTYLMAVGSAAPRVVTFRKDRRKQPDTGRVRHAVDDFTKELRPLGISRVDDRQLDFFVPDAARDSVEALLRDEGMVPDRPLVVVNPAATREINRWPAARFAEFFDAMGEAAPNVQFVLTGGRGETGLTREIAGKTQARVLDTAGRLSIKELGALLERADTVLTADTGPMHIASAVGAPLVVLSGAADPDRTGPLSPDDLVVINRDLPCVPCQGRHCKRGDIACMTQMPVDWVVSAVRRRLSQTGRERRVSLPLVSSTLRVLAACAILNASLWLAL